MDVLRAKALFVILNTELFHGVTQSFNFSP
jgi:hypothetical protein